MCRVGIHQRALLTFPMHRELSAVIKLEEEMMRCRGKRRTSANLQVESELIVGAESRTRVKLSEDMNSR